MSIATTNSRITTRNIQRGTSRLMPLTSHRVAEDGTRHAVPAPAPLAELEALDGDDLDACCAHLLDRVCVPLVRHHDARLERDHVVAVVPLLAFLLVSVPTGGHHLQLGHAHGVRNGIE